VSGSYLAPAGAVYALVLLAVNTGATAGSYIYWDDVELYPLDDDIVHASGNVVIDSTGITIDNGALILKDEFSKTTMVASGFSGSWTDFVRLGLYNARFTDVTVGALTVGRAATLPYWTLTQSVGAPTFTGLSGGGVKVAFAALNNSAGVGSDKVPVRPGTPMQVGYCYKINRAAGTITLRGYVYWYKSDGTSSATVFDTFSQQPFTATVSALTWFTNTVTVPDDAVQANVLVTIEETGTHSASNYASLYAVELIDTPSNIPTGWKFGDSATAYVTPGSGTVNNYNPGAIDSVSILEMAPTAALTLTGMVAPQLGWRLIAMFNYSAYSITLKNENASSSSANRFNLPGGVDLVIRADGIVLLLYQFTSSRWMAFAI
jgi:hypothetical protein